MKPILSLNAPCQQKSARQNAQGMMEFALVMPILLLVVYGLFEVGRLVFIYSNVITAAREAVRYGSASGIISQQPQYKDCNGIRAAAQQVDFLDAITNNDIHIYYYDATDATTPIYQIENTTCPAASVIPSVPSGGRIRVSVSGTFSPLSAFVRLRSFTLTSSGERTILGVMHVAGGSPPSGGGGGGGASDGQAPTLRKDFSP
jgi:Flp pilus assembly protein TadG